jgi:hypothetical protein
MLLIDYRMLISLTEASMTISAVLTPSHLRIGRASFSLDSLPPIEIEPPRQFDDRADEDGTGAHRLLAYGIRTIGLLAFASTTDSLLLSVLLMALGGPVCVFAGALVEAGGQAEEQPSRADRAARVLLVGLAVLTVCALAVVNSVWESLIALAVAYPWAQPPVPTRAPVRGHATLRLAGDATATVLSCADRSVLERLRDRITDAAEHRPQRTEVLDLAAVSVSQADLDVLVTLPRSPRVIELPAEPSRPDRGR